MHLRWETGADAERELALQVTGEFVHSNNLFVGTTEYL